MLINANGSLVSHVATRSLGSSLGNTDCKLKKVKSERSERTLALWVEPLYGAPPNIIFDRNNLVSRKQFATTYYLCYKGPSLKHLKLSKDFKEVDIEKIFRQYLSRIGYQYSLSNNKEIIAKI
jgi:hypothetical protein